MESLGAIRRDDIERLAHEAGFDLCGVCRAEPMEDHMRRWLQEGYGGDLEYLHRNLEMRLDPSKIVEGGRSVVVCGVNYKSRYSLSNDTGIASYAMLRDYHKTLRKRLKHLLRSLQQLYPEMQGRPFVDTAPLLEKALAVKAGLGWVGRQSLLVTPQYGSFVSLGEIVIDCEVDSYSDSAEGDRCGGCRRCIEACPVGAINDDRTIDTRLCISARTVERVEVGEATLAGWVFGCDMCQSCCPHNQSTPLASDEELQPRLTPPTREEWLTMSDEQFDHLSEGTPLRRSSLGRIRSLL